LAVAPLLAQEPTLRVKEADLRAAATHKVEPDYPAIARQIRLVGDVELEVTVSGGGDVESVKVLQGNTLLVGSSVQAIRKWKFQPFREGGAPARAVGPVRFRFKL
jgi:protein TonB